MLADEQPTPEQIAIYRRMTPERRLALAEGLYWTARELKAAWLRAQHADWSESQVSPFDAFAVGPGIPARQNHDPR